MGKGDDFLPTLKNFGITFLISALIFSIVAYFLVGFLTSTVSGILDEENGRLDSLFTEEPENSSDDSAAVPDTVPEVEGNSFTVLFGVTDRREELFDYYPDESKLEKLDTGLEESVGTLVCDYQTVKVKSIVLMRVSKETGEYTFISVPSVSKVYAQMGAGYTLLEDLMYFYNKDYFVQKVSAMTGITPDYTVFVNVTDMDDVLKEIGGVSCYIPDDIYTDGKSYFPNPYAKTSDDTDTGEKDADIKKAVSAGNVTVGASNIEAILLYENYEDGIKERSELLTNLLRGVMGRLSRLDNSGLSKVYKSLTKDDTVDTDIRESELLAKGELIRAYDSFTKTTFEYPGTVSNGEFSPETMNAVKQLLGLRIPADKTKNS